MTRHAALAKGLADFGGEGEAGEGEEATGEGCAGGSSAKGMVSSMT
jgi:hypothetical protein